MVGTYDAKYQPKDVLTSQYLFDNLRLSKKKGHFKEDILRNLKKKSVLTLLKI